MYKLCRIDIERSKETYEELRDFIKNIKNLYPIKEVYLFGSFARGDFNEGSDIDLLIIGDFKERFLDRPDKFLELTDLPIEAFCYTEKEIQKMKKRNNRFVEEALKGIKL
ncbi:MAG: nucleotidyltransferase domain-containing protein [Methanosarcinales archaeon]